MKRDDFTLTLNLGDELLIDSFASGGGASEDMSLESIQESDSALALFSCSILMG